MCGLRANKARAAWAAASVVRTRVRTVSAHIRARLPITDMYRD